jgi:hypothetical protein
MSDSHKERYFVEVGDTSNERRQEAFGTAADKLKRGEIGHLGEGDQAESPKEKLPVFTRELSEAGPEHILPREKILLELRNRCENFQVERELSDEDGIYFLEVMSADNAMRYSYQRKGSFPGGSHRIESTGTTIRSEDVNSGWSETLADYDEKTGEWVNQ